MAGRPAAPRFIVPEGDILDDNAFLNENYNITLLARELVDTLTTIRWCARHRLLANLHMCPQCAVPCGLIFRAQLTDCKTWYCSLCKHKQSIREGSWFMKSHVSLYNLVLMTYCWASDYPQKTISKEASCTALTIVDWCNFQRELCEEWLERNPIQIGGISDDGEAIIVEVDESKYFHRKYHRGQWREGH